MERRKGYSFTARDDEGEDRLARRALVLAASAGAGGLMLVCAGTYSLLYGLQSNYSPLGSSGPPETTPLEIVTLLGFLILSAAGGALVARVAAGGWVRAMVASVGGWVGGFPLPSWRMRW